MTNASLNNITARTCQTQGWAPATRISNADFAPQFQSHQRLQAEAVAREVLGDRTILDASEIAAARAEINQRLEALRRPEQRVAA